MELNFGVDRFNPFFILSPEMMALLSPEGRLLEVNPAWEKCLGFSPREIKKRAFLELLDPQDLPQAQVEIDKFSRGVRTATFEARCRRKDGTVLWVRWTLNRPESGEASCLIGRDLGELRAIREELKEYQGKFQRLTESANEGIAIHEKGVILEANDALARMFGFVKGEEMVGRNALDFTAPEYQQVLLNNIQSGNEEPYEVAGLRRDGSRFNCLLTGKAILYHGRPVRVSTLLDVTQMKKREQELFESQELFRKLAEASRDGIAVSEKGKILLANPALARMLGMGQSELIGRHAVEFTAPEFREPFLKRIADESESSYEMMLLKKDGSRLPVEVNPRMISYQGRRVRLSFFRDVTHRRTIEEDIRREKDFSQSLINSSVDGLLAFDAQCRYTLWNPAMERISGHSREECLGRCAFDVFPFLQQIGEDRYFHDALAGKTVLSQERPYRTPAGREGFFEAHYMPIRNSKGEIIGGLGVIHDITERKKAEAALRLSEADLKAVFNNTFQNIVLLDREGKIRAFNPNAAVAFRENSGRDLEAGRPLTDYIQPAHQAGVLKLLAKARKGKVTHLENTFLMKDGRERWFEVKYHPVFGEKGEIEGICLTSLDIDERKKAEETVEKSEADLRAVFNSSHQDIVLVDREGRIREFNVNAERDLYGATGQELKKGRKLEDYVEPEHVEGFRERFGRVLKGERVRIERPVRGVDGKDRWFEFLYSPVLDHNGATMGVCMAVTSIDERKKAEEALQKSEADLRAIFNSSLSGFVLAGPDGRVRDFNQNAQEGVRRITGKDLVRGPAIVDFMKPAHREAFAERFASALKGGAIRLERMLTLVNGGEEWFEFTFSPVSDLQGQVVGVCMSLSSIHERKKAEEALRESEEKFRKVFEDASIGMTLVGPDLKFLNVNQAFSRMLGYTAGELVGRSFQDITHPDDRLESKFRPGETPASFQRQKRYLCKDGRVVWGNLSVTSFLDEKGGLRYRLGMVEDITERKAAEEALRQSELDLKAVFNSGHQGLALLDREGRIRAFNPVLEESIRNNTGQSLERGRSFLDYVALNAHEAFRKTLEEAFEGKTIRVERRFTTAKGEEHWVEATYQPVFGEGGKVEGVCLCMAYIDDRKKAEEALRQSESDLRAVFNSGSQVVVLIHRDGRIQGFNKSAEVMAQRIMGIQLEKEMAFIDTLPPGASPETYRQSFQAALEGRETVGERPIRSMDGASRWVEVKYQPVRNGEGGVDGVCFSLSFIDDRKRAEEALKHSEAQLRAVFDSGPQTICLIGLDGRLQALNKVAEEAGRRTNGFPPQVGRMFLDYVPEANRAAFLENFGTAAQGRPARGERSYRGVDGEERWVEVTFQPVFNDRGEVEGICYVSVSIDERKKSEEKLRESQERFQRLAQLSKEGILIHGNPTVVDVNPALAAMLGYEAEEMIGKSGFDFLSPESRDLAREKMAQGSTRPYEVMALRKDGTTFPVELQGMNYRLKDRELRVMTVQDLTLRKEAERTLRGSEERYRHLVEVTPLAMAVIQEEGRIVFANPEAARLFHAERWQDLIGKTALDFSLPENAGIVKERIRRVIEEGASADNRETEMLTLDGQKIIVEVRGVPILFQGRRAAMSIFRDVTESRKIREMLLHYERLAAVGKVIAGIAHEIRNPLAVVSGMTQLLKAKIGDDPKYSQEVETILDQSRQLKLFMEDILDFSREMKVIPKAVQARPLLEKALTLAQSQAETSHRGVKVEWKIGEGLPSFQADPQRLEQVMVNLITNAYQALAGKGNLTLSARAAAGRIQLGVEDDGPGIPEADAPRIFEPFFTTKAHGSGLGLSISQKIAEAHGGRIEVARLEPHGTRFILWLPCPEAAVPQGA